MKTFSLQTRLYSGQGSLAVLKRFTNKHIWIICDGFLARSPLLDTLRNALPADNRISVFSEITPDPTIHTVVQGIAQMQALRPQVVIGFGGIAGHTFIGLHKAENSYFHRAMSTQDYSAVTAACMMSKKALFEEVGGFSEELAVAFNDIDYCMKVQKAGKLVVYNPYALLYHYESKSRGLEDTPEKVERFNREIKIFSEKWPEILKNGDPYYNPNLTLRKSNFALRDLKKEKIGEPYKLDI